jgi:outer membrane protein TolC
MFFLKKNNFYLILLSLMTSCSFISSFRDNIEIPCDWQSPLEENMTMDDPTCFRWWEPLNDPLLTELIELAALTNDDIHLAALQSKEKWLQTVNLISTELAKNYIELRGLQVRLEILQAIITAQTNTFALNEGLSQTGFINTIEQNESQKKLDSLLIQKSQMEFSKDKIVYHISTLLSYPPSNFNELLCSSQPIPKLPNYIPIGTPMDLIQRDPETQAAKRAYRSSHNKQAFYNYRKKVLSALEETEDSLTELHYTLEKNKYLSHTKQLKEETYYSTQELYEKGLKDDRDLLTTYQELLSDENVWIQSQIDLLTGYINLYQALWAGWEADCKKQWCK